MYLLIFLSLCSGTARAWGLFRLPNELEVPDSDRIPFSFNQSLRRLYLRFERTTPGEGNAVEDAIVSCSLVKKPGENLKIGNAANIVETYEHLLSDGAGMDFKEALFANRADLHIEINDYEDADSERENITALSRQQFARAVRKYKKALWRAKFARSTLKIGVVVLVIAGLAAFSYCYYPQLLAMGKWTASPMTERIDAFMMQWTPPTIQPPVMAQPPAMV